MAATLTSVSPTIVQPSLDRENSAPARAGLVLSTLIVAAAVANLPLGMASGTADLQRDLGGAIMQSIFGVLLAGGYAVHMAAAVAKAPQAAGVDAKTTIALEMSISGAQMVAAQYPQAHNRM